MAVKFGIKEEMKNKKDGADANIGRLPARINFLPNDMLYAYDLKSQQK